MRTRWSSSSTPRPALRRTVKQGPGSTQSMHDDAWRRELETERAMKDEFMARHPESPFVAGRVPFHPLRYFGLDAGFRVVARLERVSVPEEAYLRTNRDNQAVMRYLGDLTFTLEGRSLRLKVYHAGEGVGTSVFVPFRDRTSGRECYGPGRYLTLELTESDEYDLDFNRAFNPYCAYTDDYECGFPPAENDLPVPIRAGEKVWAEERNPRSPSSLMLARRGRRLDRPAAARSPSRPARRRPPGSVRTGGTRRSRPGRTGPRRPRGADRGPASTPSRRRGPSHAGSAGRSEGSRTSRPS